MRKVVLTKESKRREAVKQQAETQRKNTGLSDLNARLSLRVATFAKKLQRGAPSLETLVKAAEGVINARIRETEDPCHPDVIALRRCVWNWTKHSNNPMTLEQLRVFGQNGWGQ
jgi:hypothetical protein